MQMAIRYLGRYLTIKGLRTRIEPVNLSDTSIKFRRRIHCI